MEKNQNKLQTSNVIFETTINCFLASNLLAQFSRQIVVQIIGMARRHQKFVGISQYVQFKIDDSSDRYTYWNMLQYWCNSAFGIGFN
jgi:hypothetical protein